LLEQNRGNETQSKRSNRLIREKSPYLLQHAHNPVDWYPWGEEAIQRAKRENKPIFLSIGYSSCHWCHVQEKESFEDLEIAKLMNENFVCIKVDREERPDLDEIYMKAVVAMTGSGGWPLNVFLTPTLEPFYGGTYFPPTPRQGLPGFSNVLNGVAQSWKTERKTINESAQQMKSALVELYSSQKSEKGSDIERDILDEAYTSLVGTYDKEYGGFGRAPKFPIPSQLSFLMRYYKRTKQRTALQMVLKTLDSMASGGIYDQIGGGFHRYSTDRFWLVPHFEKMLYDNALLALAYIEGFQLTQNERYEKVVNETLNWVLREMAPKDDSGGFYSAVDADSPDGEGSYYVWNRKQIQESLKSDSNAEKKSNLVADYFTVTDEGNFDDGESILTSSKTIELVAQDMELNIEDAESILRNSIRQMLEQRSKRQRPMVDDKILSAWNGLMISAMSKAYQVFEEKRYLQAAKKTADLILTKLVVLKDNKPILLRRLRDGEVKGNGLLEDYSFFVDGLIDLYESCFDPKYLENAIRLCDQMICLFQDEKEGGFYLSPSEDSDLVARPKDAYDGALPSGNSVAVVALLRLAELTGQEEYKKKAEDTMRAFWHSIGDQPSAYCHMLMGLEFYFGSPKEIVISGKSDAKETDEFLRIIRNQFLPNSIVALADSRIEKMIPLVEGKLPAKGQKPRVFVCSNYSCTLPSQTKEQLVEALAA